MGWCSGTDVVDAILRFIYSTEWWRLNLIDDEQIKLVAAIIDAFENHDWDCQSDSGWWDDPIFQAAIERLHPDWKD